MATLPTNFNVNIADLTKILDQIKIAEAHASRVEAGEIVAGTPIQELVSSPLAPEGLRTVDGKYNNTVPGRELWGSADQPMPQLLDQVWVAGEINPRTGQPTHYGLANTVVYDSAPRVVSNLISDQTISNPAAVIAALTRAGSADPYADAQLIADAIAAAKTALAGLRAALPALPPTATDAQVEAAARDALLTAQMEADAAASVLATAQTALGNANTAMAAALDVRNAAVATLLAATSPEETTDALAALAIAQQGYANAQVAVTAAQDTVVLEQGIYNAEASDVTALSEPLTAIDTSRSLPVEMGLEITPNGSITIEAIAPDIGISAPFNSWMTLFGQFFDHGLDLVGKGNGAENVYITLKEDDPLYVAGSPTNFMVLTRATNVNIQAGPDNVLGTNDDTRQHANSTTPFVDQNQTYTSHASHQAFLREYVRFEGKSLSTGHLLDGANNGIANWGEIKAHVREFLGIQLVDLDVLNVPLLATDEYGNLLLGANGYAQFVTSGGLLEANPADNGGLGTLFPTDAGFTGFRTGHAFLDDIAHNAAPGFVDHDRNPSTAPIAKLADADSATGNAIAPNAFGVNTTYDNELLDRHFITGDGRGNENIGLTAVHHVFHAEHNRLVEDNKLTILSSNDLAFINEWLLVDIAALPANQAEIDALTWDGSRLFQAARFATEMQYQHMVFEEFARKVYPAINLFVFSASADLDPAIFAEFAHVVYRFGHSMLREDVDRLGGMEAVLDANGVPVVDENGAPVMAYNPLLETPIGLIEAFLNPVEYDASGIDAYAAAGAIAAGMARQQGNQIDEFLTEALRSNLVGLPLDLGALNIARGRETGVPAFNLAREQFYEMTGEARLKPYESWADFGAHLENPASIVNFIAAYGTHITITSATTAAGKRDAAMALVFGGEGAPEDRIDFLNAGGVYAGGLLGGLNSVDFWIGGLAEAKEEFVSMLGPTFTFVFEAQLENLQNGDRFYYLSRTQGMNLLNQLEGNTFSQLVMRNTNLGEIGMPHLPGNLFDTIAHILEVDQSLQQHADPVGDNPVIEAIQPMVDRDGANLKYSGPDHVVLGGTEVANKLTASIGDDTLWGDGGADTLEGGFGNDRVFGGAGDDIITNQGGDDFLHGQDGDDVISMGSGVVLAFGDRGSDFIIYGPDDMEAFAGEGNDFLLGGTGNDMLMAGEGDDWLEGGEGFDGMAGENSELFFNSPIIGHDVMNGGGNDTDYDGESGDDIMMQNDGIQRNNGMLGFDWAIHKGDPTAANSDLGIPFFPVQTVFTLRDRFDSVEGLSGWMFNDTLTGSARLLEGVGTPGGIIGAPANGNDLLAKNVSLINGLADVLGLTPADLALLDPDATVFAPTDGSEILLGGGGSDSITGNLGNDIIDGDKWLNVRIAVTGHPTITSIDSLAEIKDKMLSGEIKPSQLSIVREILKDDGVGDVDVAVFSGLRSEYTLNRIGVDTITVAHTGGTGTDGVDTVSNVELLRFLDGDFNATGINAAPTGAVLVVGDAIEDGLLFADTTGIVDLDGFQSAFDFQWFRNGVAIGGAIGESYTPGDLDVDQTLTVRVTYTDLAGTVETITSAPTAPVANVNDTPEGGVTINNTAPSLNQTLTASNTLTDADGLGAIGYQWEQSADGINWSAIGGATAATFTTTLAQASQQVRVVASYTDARGAAESVASTGTTAVFPFNVIAGTLAAELINGTTLPDQILGNGGNDTLNGGDGNDSIVGAAGNDWLNGQVGNDTMVGGAGNDAFVVNSLADVVVEAAGGGIDTVNAWVNGYTLADNVENLVLVLPSGLNGNGNALNNTITGNTQDNVIDGGLGNDTMIGGAGNDTYYANSTADVVTEAAAAGTDSVISSASYTLSGNVENLTLTGVAGLSGTGNGLDNVVTGNDGANLLLGVAGNDTLIGGGGNDTLSGGAGKDFLTGGAGNDMFDFDTPAQAGNGAAARDVITDFVQGEDRIDLSGIDADTTLLGLFGLVNNTFSSTIVQVGGPGAAFSANAQLHYYFDGGNTIIEGNVNGANGTAEFQIQVNGLYNFTSSDFVL